MENEAMRRERLEREEIVSDLDSSMFLEAGAGAGKTHILTQRIIRQLSSGTSPSQIAAITFTNKAAQELKERIGRGVRDALHAAPGGSEEKKNLSAALRELDRMQISTIHGFCRRLLAEQTFLAGLRPDMELIEEEKETEAKEAFFRRWYRGQSYERIRHFQDNFMGKRAADVLRNAFAAVCGLPPETEPACDRRLLARTLQSFTDEAERMARDLEDTVLDRIGRETGRRPASMEQADAEGFLLSAFMNSWRDMASGKRDALSFVTGACAPGKGIFRTGKGMGAKKAGCDAQAEVCRAEFLAGHDPERLDRERKAFQNALIMDFILPAVEDYRRESRNRYVTNDMLLQKARDLVTEHPEARAFFREKFRCIYVDEFQDTDHVQADLIFALCSDDGGRLRPGSLFVVGDPKQSIYRFRGADLPLYYEVRERMAGTAGCRLFSLDMNFRSGPEVIGFVNRNGERFLPGYRDMVCAREGPEGEAPDGVLSGVYVTWDRTLPPETMPAWDQAADAVAVADVIGTLVSRQTGVWDKNLKIRRPVRYRDFLVLCYTGKDMGPYLREMNARDIPVQISGELKLDDVRELRRFANLYRGLAYPGYARAEEGALQALLEGTVTEENRAKGEERLARLRGAVRGMDGLAAALWLARHPEYWLDRDRRIEAHYLQWVQAQVRQMIENAAETARDHPQALADAFGDWLGGTVDRELTLSREADAVRLMNLHKAKGLEGRVVIVCKRKEDFSFREASLQVRKDGGDGYLYYHTAAEELTKDGTARRYYPAYGHLDEVRSRAEEEELGEYRRLEYVEATRAMEALIFLPPFRTRGSAKRYSFRDHDYSGAKDLKDLLGGPRAWMPGEDAEGPEEGRKPEEREAAPPAPLDCRRRDPVFPGEQAAPAWLRLTPSSLETGAEPAAGEAPEDADRPAGALFGTVMHRAFELLVREMRKTGLPPGAEILGRCAAQAVMESWEELEESCGDACGAEAERYRDFLGRVLEDFAENSDLPGLVLRAERVYAEMPFSFFTDAARDGGMFEALRRRVPPELAAGRLPEDPDTPVWVSGKADLVLVGADGTVTVADYKSDRNPGLDPEAFRASVERRYGGQMELYRQVCAKLFGVPAEMVSGRFYTI